MNCYLITFADGLEMKVSAADRDDAQEKAIDAMEAQGFAHDSIVTIKRAAA